MDTKPKVIYDYGRLERWVRFNDALVGYVFDNKKFPPGTRILTEPLRFIDLNNFYAECHNEKYKLGEPGTEEEHNRPLL